VEKSRLARITNDIVMLGKPSVSINIAGNGIYSLNMSQCRLDSIIWLSLAEVIERLKKKGVEVLELRSGGQSGVDEAGLKAARRLGIPCECLAPKGWLFRDSSHCDISDEVKFKARFI
jgi:hypothetical protein